MQMDYAVISAIEEFIEKMAEHVERISSAVDEGKIDFETGEDWIEACENAIETVREIDQEV